MGECARHHDIVMVHLSLGNEVVLYCTVRLFLVKAAACHFHTEKLLFVVLLVFIKNPLQLRGACVEEAPVYTRCALKMEIGEFATLTIVN